jgi:hypothetical protein
VAAERGAPVAVLTTARRVLVEEVIGESMDRGRLIWF